MTQDLHQTTEDFEHFITGFRSVILATSDTSGSPESSYAPFIRHEGIFYIFVSELAIHTRNMLANPQACLLFIEDEDKTANIFARKRATIRAEAAEISRSGSEASIILDLLEAAHGNTMQLLRGLSDFHLLALTPSEATYTAGFGKAYRLSGNSLSQIEQVRKR